MSKALFLLHGFLTCTDDWDVLIPYLRPYYDEIVTYKQPGHEPNGVRPHFADFNADASFSGIEEQIGRLSAFDRVDVMGHSMGCAGAAYACSLLGNVGRVVMYAPAFRYPRTDILIKRGAYLRRLKKLQTDCADKELLSKLATRTSTVKESYSKSVDLFFGRLLPHWSLRNLMTFARIMKRGREYLPSVRRPLCVFWGDLDEFIPFSSVRLVLKRTQSAEKYLVRYPDDGHALIYLGNVPRLARDTLIFLNGGSLVGAECEKGESRMCCRIVKGAAAGYVTVTGVSCDVARTNERVSVAVGRMTETYSDGGDSIIGRLDKSGASESGKFI